MYAAPQRADVQTSPTRTLHDATPQPVGTGWLSGWSGQSQRREHWRPERPALERQVSQRLTASGSLSDLGQRPAHLSFELVVRNVFEGVPHFVENGKVPLALGFVSIESLQVASGNNSCDGNPALFNQDPGLPAKDLIQE